MKRIFILFLLIIKISLLFSTNPQITTKVEIEQIEKNLYELKVIYNIPDNYHLIAQKKLVGFSADEVKLDSIIYPYTSKKIGDLNVYYKQLILKANFIPTKNIEKILINVFYQVCSEDGVCFLPQKKTIFIDLPQNKFFYNNNFQNFFNLIKNIFLAVFVGFILNFMPCVLPVLSLKILKITNLAKENKKEAKNISLIYLLGILSCFSIIAIISIFIKSINSNFNWGFQFQNFYYVFFLALFIFLVGLYYVNAFYLNFPYLQIKTNKKYYSTFLNGFFIVLLSTSCTAPFLSLVLIYAFSKSYFTIFIIYFFLGVGLGLPFLIVGFFQKLIKFLPKPGNWNEKFKIVIGYILIITSFWFFKISITSFPIKNSFNIFLFVLLLFIFLKYFLNKKFFFFSLIVIVLSFTFLIKNNFIEDKNQIKSSFSEEFFYENKEQNKAIWLSFSADWCITCKLNEKIINSTEIQEKLAEKKVIFMKGDYTKSDKTIEKWLKKYKSAGVPLNILFIPHEKKIVFPVILTKKIILKELEKF